MNVLSSIFRIEAWYECDLAQATNMMEYTVQFLLMELESVGNIRLEEGFSTDPWCVLGIISTTTTFMKFTATEDKSKAHFP